MSTLNVLELDTQTELLDRLELLTNFSSKLIAINGKRGYGKSWLAQRYLEVGADDKNQCLLSCHPTQNEFQQRTTIIGQLVPEALFDHQDSLSEILVTLLNGDDCNAVIVIDDAHLLSEHLVTELWELVQESQTHANWSISVLLFTETRQLESILSPLASEQEAPIELDIELLSEVEARHFFETRVIRYIDDKFEKRVRTAFKRVDPIPGSIMALGEIKAEKRIIIRLIVGSPLKITIAILALGLILAGGYLWVIYQPSPDDQAKKLTHNVEQMALPSLDSATASTADNHQSGATETNQQITQDDQSSIERSTGVQDDSKALPPLVISTAKNVGDTQLAKKQSAKKRVIIDSNVVDALVAKENPQAVHMKSIDANRHKIVETPIVATVASKSKVAPKKVAQIGGDQSIKAQPIKQTTPSKKQAKQPAVNPFFDELEPVRRDQPIVRHQFTVRHTEVAKKPVAKPVALKNTNKIKPAISNKLITFSFAREQLQAVPAQRYTLQLAAYDTLDTVQNFIERYKLEGKVRVYPTQRGQKTWLIVTYHDYATIQDARNAAHRLAPPLRHLRPWAKSLRQVHQEIGR